MKDFYYILGTGRDAAPPEIEAAYQKLARRFYRDGEDPDEFMDSHFREIAEAYDMLRDAGRRRKYDAAFKRNQQKNLAAFKLKYLNIAVAVTFLVVTALFAGYVIRSIRGHAAKKPVVKTATPPPVIATAPTHSKKHHKIAGPLAHRPLTVPDTANDHKVAEAGKVSPAAQPTPSVQDGTTSLHPAPLITLHANITGIIYLHQAPDYNSSVLAKIPGETRVSILQKGATYTKVSFNGQEGYVLTSSISGQR